MANDYDLRQWISNSEQTREGLKRGLGAFVALSIIVTVGNRAAGVFMLFVAAVVAIAGFWVIASHISDWRRQLERKPSQAPLGPRAASDV